MVKASPFPSKYAGPTSLSVAGLLAFISASPSSIALAAPNTAPTPESGAHRSREIIAARKANYPAAGRDFIAFESVPSRPFARLGQHLFVVNPQAARLEMFEIDDSGQLTSRAFVPTGMEPIAVSVSPQGELWVVNHLSDSVSVIDPRQWPLRVKRTLLVGDEPRDIVFAKGRAFVTTAHRGQQRVAQSIAHVPGAGDPLTHTAGVPRADVWVFDAKDQGWGLGGVPEKIVELFGDTPRALAVSADGNSVFAAILHSGNQSSVVHEAVMCHGFVDDPPGPHSGKNSCQVMDGIHSPNGESGGLLPGGRPAPGRNAQGQWQPWTSMIVKYDEPSGQWRSADGRNFSNGIRFHLPDLDVFRINAATLQETGAWAHVGTTLYNMVSNPVTGELYVSNTEANNAARFEGPGEHAGTTLQGNLARAQITRIDPQRQTVSPRHLNPHIDYDALKAPAVVGEHSIATPQQMTLSADGRHLYVAALGSDRVAVYDTRELASDAAWKAHDPYAAARWHYPVKGGPVGVELNEAQDVLYTMNWSDHSLATIKISTGQELQRLPLFNPEPKSLAAGRSAFYDAKYSSSNGEASCASCHIHGDADQLAWNLGNPDEGNTRNPQPQPTRNLTELSCTLIGQDDPGCELLQIVNGEGDLDSFASMKGPMGTQTLRGMSTHGHMHWRGDRSNGYFGVDWAQTLDEKTSFKNFIAAFDGLLGKDIDLPKSARARYKSFEVMELEGKIDQMADFALALQMPPNPHRGLDNTLSNSAALGRAFFHGDRRSDGSATDFNFNGPEADGVNCAGCHPLDEGQGFFGTDGSVAHGGEIQMLKVPQLRNLYQRVGMFGLPDREGFLPSSTRQHQGDQIRGFGFLHDGATDKLFNFLQGGVFDNGEQGCPEGLDSSHGCEFNLGMVGIPDDTTRQGIVDYLMAFESDLAPVVGQQVTLSMFANIASARARIELFRARARAPFRSKILGGTVKECELIAQGVVHHQSRSFLYRPEFDAFVSDRSQDGLLSLAALYRMATLPDQSLTFTCVPYGSGFRMALDADRNAVLDGDDRGSR